MISGGGTCPYTLIPKEEIYPHKRETNNKDDWYLLVDFQAENSNQLLLKRQMKIFI